MGEACVAWRQEEEQVAATQKHIQVCPAYSRLRVGRDLEGSYLSRQMTVAIKADLHLNLVVRSF